MKLTDKQKKWVDIIQWALILLLMVVCLFDYFGGRSTRTYQPSAELQRENTYIKIYDSQRIENLKNENKALHDSIKNIRNAETAVEVRYLIKHTTDTIKETQFVRDLANDSIYHYTADNDTVQMNIDVKAAQLDWVQSSFSIRDKFRIINAEEDGENHLYVDHSPNVTIEGVDAWHREPQKKKWYNHIHAGPAVGFGYGITSRQVDVFVGGAIVVTF